MNKVLRCTVLSALFATSLAATVLAAPFQLPVAISTPSVDQINIAGYGDSIHSADVRFTINEDGSVGDIEYDQSSISVTVARYVTYNEDTLKADGTLDNMTFDEFVTQNNNRVK